MYKYCVQGEFRVTENFASKKNTGESCNTHDECARSYCKNKKCSIPNHLANCTSNNDCDSGFCKRNVCDLKPLGKSCEGPYQCSTNKCSTKCID